MRTKALVGLALLASIPMRSHAQTPGQPRVLIAAARTLDSLSARLADSTITALRRQAPHPRSIIPHEMRRDFLESSGTRGVVLTWEDVRALMRILRADVLFDVIASRQNGQIQLAVTRLVGFRGEPVAIRTIVASAEADAVDQFVKLILADAAVTAPPGRQPPNEQLLGLVGFR